jgi:hypothetical protein
MATCDVRELIVAHVKEISHSSQGQRQEKVSARAHTVQPEPMSRHDQDTASRATLEPSPRAAVAVVDAGSKPPTARISRKPGERIDLESINFGETVGIDVPLDLLKEAFIEHANENIKYQAYDMRPGYRQRCTIILRTALAFLKQEIRATESYQRRRALREQKRAVYSVFELAKQVPPQIELELHYQRGKHGQALCHVQLAIPVIRQQRRHVAA